MRRWLAAGSAVALLAALGASASAKRLLGAGRESVALVWEAASGPVAFYEVSCTVDGEPGVLVGTSSEPRLEIGRDPSRWGQSFDACVVRAFDGDGNPGPASEPSNTGFTFLADVDLNGDGIVGASDVARLRLALRRGYRDVASFIGSMGLALGCRVDRASRTYVACPETAGTAP